MQLQVSVDTVIQKKIVPTWNCSQQGQWIILSICVMISGRARGSLYWRDKTKSRWCTAPQLKGQIRVGLCGELSLLQNPGRSTVGSLTAHVLGLLVLVLEDTDKQRVGSVCSQRSSNNNMTKETAYGGDVKPWQDYATGVVEEDDFFYCFSHKKVEATESGMNLSWPQETAVEPEWSFGDGKYFKLSVHHTHVRHVGGKPSHLRVRGGRSVQRVHSTFAPAPVPTASWRGWWSL